MKPRFSVLIPAYNRERYVAEAVDSVLAQTYTNFELFVVDDGSTDGTAGVLRGYGDRVKVLQQLNQGPEVARNQAAALAQGEYLVFLDSDDLLTPLALATYDRVIRAYHSPPLIIGSMNYFADNVPRLGQPEYVSPVEVVEYADYFSKRMSLGLSNSRIVVRKTLFDEVGGLRRSSPATFHLDDFNLILKVGGYGPCLIVTKPDTVLYRSHDSNSIRSPEAMVNGVILLARAERSGEYPGGSKRRMARYACIGGIALLWIKYSWRWGYRKTAMRLFLATIPMIGAAVANKVFGRFAKSTAPVVLD